MTLQKISLGTWKHTSSILAGLFVHHQHGSNSYVASYAPIATALMTNKNPAQILDDYLFPGALGLPSLKYPPLKQVS